MTVKLCHCVITPYNDICSSQQGELNLTNLVLDEIFFMFSKVINDLNNFLKTSTSKGLTQIQYKISM